MPWAPRCLAHPLPGPGLFLYLLLHHGVRMHAALFPVWSCGGLCPGCPHTCPWPCRPSLCSAQMESCRNARRWCTPCLSMRLTSSTPVLRASWPSSQVSCPSSAQPTPSFSALFLALLTFLTDLLLAFCSPSECVLPCTALKSSLGSLPLSLLGHLRVQALLLQCRALLPIIPFSVFAYPGPGLSL